jgi:hypothetical protein
LRTPWIDALSARIFAKKLRPIGTPLREWQYTVEDLRYHVWFEEVAKDDFRVLGLTKYPKDAKF